MLIPGAEVVLICVVRLLFLVVLLLRVVGTSSAAANPKPVAPQFCGRVCVSHGDCACPQPSLRPQTGCHGCLCGYMTCGSLPRPRGSVDTISVPLQRPTSLPFAHFRLR